MAWPLSVPDATRFDDGHPGPQGVEGWWSDSLVPGARVIHFDGTWWQKDRTPPFYGFGDIMADALFFPLTVPWLIPTRAHGGFLAYADRAWHLVGGLIAVAKDKGLRVIFTGHSLGAAIAVLVALRYRVVMGDPCGCVVGALPTALGSPGLCGAVRRLLPRARAFSYGRDAACRLHWMGWIVGLFKPLKVEKVEKTTPAKGLKAWLAEPFLDHGVENYGFVEDFLRSGAELW